MSSKVRNSGSTKLKSIKGKSSNYDKKQDRMAKQIYNLVKPEMKHYRNNQTVLSVSDAGVLFDLTAVIASGTSTAQRIGQKIKIFSIYMKFAVQGADNTNYLRFMLTKSVSNNVLLADYPAVLEFPNIDLLHVYKDKLIPLTSSWNGAAVYPTKIVTMEMKFPNGITIEYTPSTGTPVSIKNQLQFYAVSDSGLPFHPTMIYNYIINFTDA